jgi:hypothetical protein
MTLSPKVDYANGYDSEMAAASAAVLNCSVNGEFW